MGGQSGDPDLETSREEAAVEYKELIFIACARPLCPE